MINTATLDQLKAALGPKGWSDDPAELDPHVTDWRGRYRGETPILLKPATTAEVAEAVRICAANGIAITPQGGNTGLVGGATPKGEVLISLKRMTAIRETDTANDSLTVEAGCILETVQETAREAGRLFPLSLGSQGSATIGGLISTNAGGVHVLRYGMMRDLVLGIEAVLPDGQIWNGLRGLRKDNSGYDLKQLFIGAEGTLGIVTAATLKLFPRPAETCVAWAAVASPDDAVTLLGDLKAATGGALSALELVPRNALDLVLKHIPGTRDPLDSRHPWHVLVEIGAARNGEGRAMMEAGLGHALESGLVKDAVIAENEAQALALWQLREPIAEAEKAHGKAAKHDLSIPVSRMPAFIKEATALIESMIPDANVIAFGHVGDGNVHFNIASQQPGTGEDFLASCRPATEAVFELVTRYNGSIAAEHGVGVLKSADLAARRPLDVALMRSVKAALDPENIMNPRVLIAD
ncbi:FAD-binding oxidoreductase [Hyphobacterium marinum]|uniref:FAD-binding oxidoreductase n=1 Tax=Hyphobacterium marinum TaxID=3116574 RepID=A0ABU7M0U5_9PROT|nr:FAD-binding oxidoreductase [Hyphobacterium sp. Y6023]MEE2567411.1 FAD-binding oxidoreductase [Hyphobacterium sp. Y6023]